MEKELLIQNNSLYQRIFALVVLVGATMQSIAQGFFAYGVDGYTWTAQQTMRFAYGAKDAVADPHARLTAFIEKYPDTSVVVMIAGVLLILVGTWLKVLVSVGF